MTATLQFIQQTFDRFNALCFEGTLPPIPIVLTEARTFLGKMEYRGGPIPPLQDTESL